MLLNLKISNLAVIKNLEIKFYEGLNVFTGETGSGKSVILKAIDFVLGARCNKDMIRFGENKACVEATFKKLSVQILGFLKNELKIQNFKDELFITRTIFKDGKTIAAVNGVNVNVASLKNLGSRLIYLNEQGRAQNLVNSDNSLKIVDDFAQINNLVLKYRESFLRLKNILKKLKQINLKIEEKNNTFTILSERIAEIEKLNVQTDEDVHIFEKLKLIKNSEFVFKNLNFVKILLSGNENSEGIINNFEKIVRNLEQISNYKGEIKIILTKFQNLFFELKELIFDLSDVKNSFTFQSSELEFLENRLSEISKIKRKYGPKLLDVKNNLEKFKLELNKIKNYSTQKEELLNLKNQELTKFEKLLLTISKKRKETAYKISNKILNELKFLEMKDVDFKIELKKHAANLNGLEEANFLISANLGEPLKPIYKVASGGELSRIMLAIVSVIFSEFKPLTLIFDEIDSGVSGVTASKIGVKLNQLAKSAQVICITHLAQIAAVADENFKIVKKNVAGRVVTEVVHLSLNEKIKEIARIVGGSQVNDLTLKLAENMVKKRLGVC